MKKKKTPEEMIQDFWNTYNFYKNEMKMTSKNAYAKAVSDYGYKPPYSNKFIQRINKHVKIDDNWVK